MTERPKRKIDLLGSLKSALGAGEASEDNGPAAQDTDRDRFELIKLDEPVQVLAGFESAPLCDAIETLLYRADRAEHPCGLERFAAMLLREVDLPRLRSISAKAEPQLAFIDRSRTFYLNCCLLYTSPSPRD